MTDWLAILRARCAATSNAAAARQLGYSDSVVSQVLSGTYRGNLANVERRVLEVFGGAEVQCPVLGTIDLSRCATERRRPFAATNPHRVRLWQCCRTCPNNPDRKDP